MPTTFIEVFVTTILILFATGVVAGIIALVIGTCSTHGDHDRFINIGVVIIIGSLAMLIPLMVGGVILKGRNDQYAKEKICSGYKVYVNGLEAEGPVDIENCHYTVDDEEKTILVTIR